MKLKKIFFVNFLCLLAMPFFALDVDEEELKSTGQLEAIVFINYTGPHSKIDSLASIKAIGSGMGEQIKQNVASSSSAGNVGKYYVKHCVDENEKEKLDADILFIGKNATVDHIKNLRYIIASYLSSAYGYDEKDAETVAVFVTVYNAVYRSKLDVFQKKYKNVVTENLTQNECGLSVNYKDWPGSSQIVIPLYDVKGGLSTVDTSVISDEEVVKNMQEDEDKNVDSRKDMVDLKEREADDANKKAQESQKKAVTEEKKASEEKAKTETKKQEVKEAEKKAESATKKANENPNDKQAQEEAKQAQEEVAQVKEELKQQEEKQVEQEKKAEEAKTEAKQAQELADKKNSEAQEERKTIASDQQEVIKKEIANSQVPSAYGIELSDSKQMLSALIKVNTDNGQVIKTSPVKYIRNRTMFQANENFIAIAGENKGNGAVKLVLLSPDTMEIIAESNEIVAENSVLIQDTNDFYCVIQDGNNWVLAKYDSNLNLKLKSNVPLSSETPVTVATQYILVTGSDLNVKLLNKSDLKLKNAGSSSSNSTVDAK